MLRLLREGLSPFVRQACRADRVLPEVNRMYCGGYVCAVEQMCSVVLCGLTEGTEGSQVFDGVKFVHVFYQERTLAGS